MSEYILKERKIPLDDSWDVIVAGGGPSGCTAAAAAAREGAKTLLIEATGSLGGMGTSGLVPAWCPFTDKEKIIYKGLAERILKTGISKMPHVGSERFDWTPIDSEILKRIYDDLMIEYGVTVLFNSFMASVEFEEKGVVDAVIVASKAGMKAYKAPVYIDCTGDADLSVWAGAEYEKGDEKGDLQPVTHCFTLTNVDIYGYQYGRKLRYGAKEPVIYDIIKSGKYPEIPDHHACNNIVGPGAVGFNAGHLWSVDNTDPSSTSSALMQGRKIAKAFRDACAEFIPEAFGNCHLTSTGSLMGIRETRRIIGDYVLTMQDYADRKSFPDEICRNNYPIDIHTTEKEAEEGHWVEAMNRFDHYKKGESHGIPYRCLTPKGLKNVLIAGRSISTDRIVQGSTRVMPVCLAMGEAAGIAAAMAVNDASKDVHSIDTGELRKILTKHGAYLP